eukprot:SAG22_NODE_8444_length_656_cov_0.718133_1_plen_58_part_01
MGLGYLQLYERCFDHFSTKGEPGHFFHFLIIPLIIFAIGMDTSICESDFSLLNRIKTK